MMQFQADQIEITGRAFSLAEQLVGRRFRLGWREMKRHHYDVKTLAHLSREERREQAFAHLCRYQFNGDHQGRGGLSHFYRVCLQDDRILDAVRRARSSVTLPTLLLYIATHELIHVIRFDRSGADFDAVGEEKNIEEQRVHFLTKEVLSNFAREDLKMISECCGPRYGLLSS